MITSWAPTPFMRSNIPSPSRSSVPSTLSAGNLFGTTRTSQPGPFAPPPFGRYASTSGGVMSSRPGQNGQCSRPTIVGRSNRKSFGRFCRSVEMITQRPVMGSFRSSGIECVLEHLDNRAARFEVNRHDVEPARTLAQMMTHDEILCEVRHPALLHRCHRLGRGPVLAALSRLHFDEHERPIPAGNDVQFATPPPISPGNDCVPAPLELRAGQIF